MPASPRSRIVLFWLSDEEYRSLQLACDLAGARSLSEFTRSTMMGALRPETTGDPLPDIERMRQESADLRTAIADLEYALVGWAFSTDVVYTTAELCLSESAGPSNCGMRSHPARSHWQN
jgi:hypothetical protein